MNKDRRNFITKSSLTLLGLGISNTLLGQIHSLVHNETTETITQKLKKAANRRRNGQLNQAKNIYNNIIAIDSNEIRAYDGLRKILLQTKYKELEVLQLYNNGLNQNPTSLIFKERVAKEYMRLSLGNKKFTNQLNIGQDLLLSAKLLFNQVRTEFPNNQQFEIQFQKAKKKINQNANTIDARINTELKVERKNNRENFKKRFKNLNNTQLEAKLNFLLAKPNSIHRIKHIKEVSIIYINKLRKNGNINLAIQKAKEMYLNDKEDVRALQLCRKLCRKSNSLDVLENIERVNKGFKNTFWSNLALFDLLLKRYKKEGVGSVSEMNSLLNQTTPFAKDTLQKFELISRKIRLGLNTNNLLYVKNTLNIMAESINGISSAELINRFNILTARYYKKNNEIEKANIIIAIGLQDNSIEIQDAFLIKIAEINKSKLNDNPAHNQKLITFRDKMNSNNED